jgi:3-phytase
MVKCIWAGLLAVMASCTFSTSTVTVKPKAATSSVEDDADDCSIWIHPQDRSLSAIIGCDKTNMGSLYVWDLAGRLLYRTPAMVKPVHVDVRSGLKLGGESVDIAVCGLRSEGKLKVFKIDPNTRSLIDITTDAGIDTVFPYECYGLCLYKNSTSGKIYVFVTSKEISSNIHQILLEDDGTGKVKGTLVRAFGSLYRKGLLEGLIADDELGYLYCSDVNSGILKFNADPDSDMDHLISKFAAYDGIVGSRQGLALYECADGKGYLILSSQGNSTLKIYERSEGNAFVKTVIKQGSSKTDGVDATSCSAGPYKHGFVVCHNNEGDNFVIYDWDDIAGSNLMKCNCSSP